tara:strand:+ start:177 stop:278 length:102 start_codon:yes stop_codon:yes gene_type:complete
MSDFPCGLRGLKKRLAAFGSKDNVSYMVDLRFA